MLCPRACAKLWLPLLWGAAIGAVTALPPSPHQAETDVSWDRALSCQEDAVVTPKRPPSQARRGQRKPLRPWAQEQPALQRSDGEEEDDEAPSPRQDGSTAVGDLQTGTLSCPLEPASVEAGAEPQVAWLGEGDVPCIISPAGGSLCDLVKSMHPYCLPAFATDLDAAPKLANKDLLAAPVMLGIVSGGDGQSLDTPVVFHPLGPGFPCLDAPLPAREEGTAGGEGHSALESPAPEEPLPAEEGAQQHQVPTPALGSKATAPDAATPKETLPEAAADAAPPEAGGRDRHLQSDSQPSTKAPAGGKCQGSGCGRGRERARKSRKKKSAEAPSTQVWPLGDSMASRLRSASSVPRRGSSEGQAPPSRATRPSAQVSNFLAEQLEQARKDAQLELRPSPAAPRPRGRPRGSRNRRSCPEPPREPAVDSPVAQSRAEQAVPSPKEQEAAAVERREESEPALCQASASPEPAPSTEQDAAGEAAQHPTPVEPAQAESQAATCPSREARPKALSLTEYRQRMQHRAPGAGPGKEPEKQAAGKWPSIPEPPTELAEIPCLVAPPAQPLALPVETPGTQKGPEKPASPPASSPPASKAPPAPALTTVAPVPPAPQLPFVAPPVTGAAPTGVVSALATPYALYPPVPSWPCFGPPPSGFPPTLLPPPATTSPNAFHLVPGLPPPGLAWPPPAVPPPPPFGPGAPYTPVGWGPALPPPYWPGVALPPLGPPLVFADPGSAPQSPSLSCPEPAAFAALPAPPFVAAAPEVPAAAQASAAAPHAAADQPPAKASRASDPRRQARPAGRPSAAPAAATAQAAKELPAAAAQAKVPSAAAVKDPLVAPTEAVKEVPAVAVKELPAATVEDPPAAATGPVEEPPPTRELPPACPSAKPARSPPGAVPAQAQPAPHSPADRETVCGRAPGAREGAKPPAARPWRHRPLARPAQPSGCEDIVQAFISEIGEPAARGPGGVGVLHRGPVGPRL